MAVSVVTSGTIVPALGTNTIWLAPEDQLGVYVALVDLHQLDGCVVSFRWGIQFPSNSSRGVWFTGSFTVADFTLEGLLTPPVPIAHAGGLFMEFESGTPGGTIEWEIFSL